MGCGALVPALVLVLAAERLLLRPLVRILKRS